MPLYDFACACGRKVELFRPMARCNRPGPRCQCGKRMRKVVTAPGGICTNDNFSYRYFQGDCVAPPPGGWPSRAVLRAALAATGQEGRLDSPACHRLSEVYRKAPPPGTRLTASQVAELEAL
jgi:putative FmdB family regulatory protein